ncbi:MAG: hypothetical protein HOI35_11745 [Woeseia sp.]|jgi:type IV pilus assembly protein PilX|nr:hypothetical protein [Woeseia sp.]
MNKFQSQRGSALIVSLIFLVVLTILGISTMSTSRLEIKMAANQQMATQASNASESGIEATLDQDGIFETEVSAGVDLVFYFNESASGSFVVGSTKYAEKASTNTVYEATGAVPTGGFSLGSKVLAYHFRILSTGESAFGSERQQTQGFYKIGPG